MFLLTRSDWHQLFAVQAEANGSFHRKNFMHDFVQTGCVDGEYLNVVDKGERLGVSLLYRYAKNGTLKSIV